MAHTQGLMESLLKTTEEHLEISLKLCSGARLYAESAIEKHHLQGKLS